jgi:hypothetical protein
VLVEGEVDGRRIEGAGGPLGRDGAAEGDRDGGRGPGPGGSNRGEGLRIDGPSSRSGRTRGSGPRGDRGRGAKSSSLGREVRGNRPSGLGVVDQVRGGSFDRAPDRTAPAALGFTRERAPGSLLSSVARGSCEATLLGASPGRTFASWSDGDEGRWAIVGRAGR